MTDPKELEQEFSQDAGYAREMREHALQRRGWALLGHSSFVLMLFQEAFPDAPTLTFDVRLSWGDTEADYWVRAEDMKAFAALRACIRDP